MGFFWTLVVLFILLALAWRYLGAYMVAVFEGRVHFLAFIERPIYALLGTSPEKEQTWRRYAGSVVVFSGLSFAITYAILRLQAFLPFYDPVHLLTPLTPDLSMNTAISFATTTTWQAYAGETTMSYATQLHYTHAVPKTPNQVSERISLAFRVKGPRVEDAASSGIYR